jgi:hypothetical protein
MNSHYASCTLDELYDIQEILAKEIAERVIAGETTYDEEFPKQKTLGKETLDKIAESFKPELK